MNRAQRRHQTCPKSHPRKVVLTYLTAAGVIGGTLGLASPANAAVYSPANCTELSTNLAALQTTGGSLTATFAATCDFAEGYVFEEPTTIIGPTDGFLTLRFDDGVSFGLTGQKELTISNLNFVGRQDQQTEIRFIQSYVEPLVVSKTTFSNPNPEFTSAIYAEGRLTVEDSSFTNLSSFESGAAIYSTSFFTPAVISNSTFYQNSAAGQGSGGAIFSISSLEISDSVFTMNQAGDAGGAIAALTSAKITNSTFVDNLANLSGSAISLSEGGIIANNTFFNNGHVGASTIAASVDTSFFANILANDNPNIVKVFNPSQIVDDLGANLYTDDSFNDTTTGEGSSKLVTVDELKLGELASSQAASINPGGTQVIAIGADSAAFDYYTADSAGINPTADGVFPSLLAATDQRGASRPLGNGYDVGAYESGEKSEPSPSETPETTEIADSESLADTGLETTTSFLALIGVGLVAIFGGSVGLVRRKRKV